MKKRSSGEREKGHHCRQWLVFLKTGTASLNNRTLVQGAAVSTVKVCSEKGGMALKIGTAAQEETVTTETVATNH